MNGHDRAFARQIIRHTAAALLARPDQVHYTQGPQRWSGIADGKAIHHGQLFPFYGDCSSTATWMLWCALHRPFKLPDVVNGENWNAGYTGTMLEHGKPLSSRNVPCGALVIYGNGAPGEHVAVSLGDGTVFSHGSEGGPYRLPMRYRPDVLSIRSYF